MAPAGPVVRGPGGARGCAAGVPSHSGFIAEFRPTLIDAVANGIGSGELGQLRSAKKSSIIHTSALGESLALSCSGLANLARLCRTCCPSGALRMLCACKSKCCWLLNSKASQAQVQLSQRRFSSKCLAACPRRMLPLGVRAAALAALHELDTAHIGYRRGLAWRPCCNCLPFGCSAARF